MYLTDLSTFPPGTEAAALFGAAGISTGQIAMLAAAVLGLTVVMIGTRRRIRDSQAAPRTTTRERYARLEEQSRAAHDLEQVMLELDELSRQIHGRLDTKLARLEAVIRDADKRIQELSELAGQTPAGSTVEITLDREEPQDAPAIASDGSDCRRAAVCSLADSGLSPVEIAHELGKTRGEVELILALRKTRETAGSPSARLTRLHIDA